MFIESESANPVIHYRSIRLARQLVDVIRGVLRPEEVPEALREFYALVRSELESAETGKYEGE